MSKYIVITFYNCVIHNGINIYLLGNGVWICNYIRMLTDIAKCIPLVFVCMTFLKLMEILNSAFLLQCYF